MSTTVRKLNGLEQKIHQAVLAAEDQVLTMADLTALEEDTSSRTLALNFLLSAGMLKPMKSASGKLQFRGVGKKEIDVKKDLNAEENLVLNHIQASGNEGIWTKHIKAKTDLHQTILDRCLKSLTQKKLVKAVSGSVQHPTRKMYMMFHLEPSVEVTGGPWYTDKELDTEFIKLLSKACLKFIRDRSFPRQSSTSESIPSERLLYPISNPPAYPSATQVQSFLNKSRITETQLTVEHVEMLLNVLCVDGDIEKVPAMGAALWDSGAMEDVNESDSDGGSRRRKKNSAKKRKRRGSSNSDEESESETEVKRKKKKAKRRKKDESDEESGSEDGDVGSKKKSSKKKRRKDESEDEIVGEGSEDDKKKAKSKSKHKKRRKDDTSSSESSSESDSDSNSRRSHKHSRSSSHQAASSSKLNLDMDFASTHVYRAIHAERLAFSFGWSQAPCLRCPTFEFCAPKGPVNPKECVYYEEWQTRKEVEGGL